MDNNPSPSLLPTLANGIYLLATSFTTILAGVIAFLFGRRQRSAETRKTDAETLKTEAEARQIDSAIITAAYKRMDELEAIGREQGLEITTVKQAMLTLEFDNRAKNARIKSLESEIDVLNLQVTRARAQGFLSEGRQPGSPNPAA